MSQSVRGVTVDRTSRAKGALAGPDEESRMTEHNYYVETPWTWRERVWFCLFPSRYCELPTAPATYQDCVITKVIVALSWRDRLRLLVTRTLTVETKTVTEHKVGATVSASVAYPSWRS